MLSAGWKPCGRVADFTDKWIIDLLSDKAPPGPKPCAAVAQLVTDEWAVIDPRPSQAKNRSRAPDLAGADCEAVMDRTKMSKMTLRIE
jgi:hypothetical protein